MYFEADLDSGRQDGSSEFGHIDAQEVTHFLCSCGEKDKSAEFHFKTKESDKRGTLRNRRCVTGVVRHGRLVRVSFLLERHVPQLKHG